MTNMTKQEARAQAIREETRRRIARKVQEINGKYDEKALAARLRLAAQVMQAKLTIH